MNQAWIYQLVDIGNTLLQVFVFYIVTNSLCKNPRTKFCKWIPIIAVLALIYLWTWFVEDATWKIVAELILFVVLNLVCYRDCVYNIIVASLMGLMLAGAGESVSLLIGEQFISPMTTIVNGAQMTALPVYLICAAVNLFMAAVLYFLFRNFQYRLNTRDFAVTFLFLAAMFFVFQMQHNVMFSVGSVDEKMATVMTVLAITFVVVFLYMKNFYALREQEQRDKTQIAQLQQQYAYYQDKLKDEERIRSIYHDMKNHLLVLEGSQGTDATHQMAQELRTQIADYENYVHTGNEFLDIILKDKAEKARAKEIDFSAAIDFEGVDFIEPLDISTLFGNGIDNAIEASEKLRAEDRVILVKAGRVQDFVSILIENNCTEEAPVKGKRTTKADPLLHGFGIANMKKAAGKYGGTCTTKRENGKFTLKILLPLPTGKVVD